MQTMVDLVRLNVCNGWWMNEDDKCLVWRWKQVYEWVVLLNNQITIIGDVAYGRRDTHFHSCCWLRLHCYYRSIEALSHTSCHFRFEKNFVFNTMITLIFSVCPTEFAQALMDFEILFNIHERGVLCFLCSVETWANASKSMSLASSQKINVTTTIVIVDVLSTFTTYVNILLIACFYSMSIKRKSTNDISNYCLLIFSRNQHNNWHLSRNLFIKLNLTFENTRWAWMDSSLLMTQCRSQHLPTLFSSEFHHPDNYFCHYSTCFTVTYCLRECVSCEKWFDCEHFAERRRGKRRA